MCAELNLTFQIMMNFHKSKEPSVPGEADHGPRPAQLLWVDGEADSALPPVHPPPPRPAEGDATLQSLAEMLNERKCECEQTAAFHEKLRAVGGKIGKSEGTRMLLREDDVQRFEFGQVSSQFSCEIFDTLKSPFFDC